uniref:EGF-like domain-containing protein n=1 Tax=Globodera pallida TaxID=36090 RepID=A0A183BT28_GLOPA
MLQFFAIKMSIIHFLLMLLINCLLPLMHLAGGQHAPTTPIHLTDKNQSPDVKMNIFFNALQQCMPPYPGNNVEAYGLEFRLPRDGGHCDDGILICYPSTLGATSNGFIMSDQYRIPNNEHMLFVEECKALVVEVPSEPARHWRGIKVYTMPPINGTRTHQIMLEASIASSPYNFGNVHQIGVHFGDREQLATYATVEHGQQAYADDELLREAFLKRVVYGARLKNYAGLWVLGMDMLPWAERNNLELYIDRSCTCTMEAWFIRPTDSVAQIIEPETPIPGSTKCPALNTDRTFTIGLIDEDDQAIVIDALTDVGLNNMTVELWETDENNISGGTALMNFSIGTTDDLKVFLPDTTPPNVTTNDGRLANGSYKMHMEIILFKHYYAIKLNGAQLGDIFLAKNWFDGIEWANRSIKLTLNGQMMLFDEPKATKINDTVKSILEKSPVKLSTTFQIAELRNNSKFLYRFQKRYNQTTSNFSIMFSNLKRPIIEPITGTAFIIQFELQDNCYNVTLKVYYGGMRHSDEEEKPIQICNKSNAIEFRFIVEQKCYEINVNGENLFGNYTNSISLDGNVNLLEQQFVPSAVTVKKSKFVYALNNTLLNYGDKIILEGILNPNSTTIEIYLQNKDERCSKVYSDVAVLTFEIDSYDPIICSHHLHKEEAAGISTGNVTSKNYQLYILSSEKTTLEILMAEDGFYGRKPGNLWTDLCPYYKPKNTSITANFIPPWTIDHISINGITFDTPQIHVEKASSKGKDLSFTIENKKYAVPWKRIQFTQVIKTEGVDRVNYSVFVNITLEKGLKPISKISINFFNEALEFHDLFGSTVLWMELSNDILFFNSFVNHNKTWSEPTQNNSFTFEIDLKMLEDNDVTPTTDLIEQFFTDTLTPMMDPENSSYSLNSTIDQQVPNSSTFMTTTYRKVEKPLELFFKIDVNETDGKAEFYVTLNGHDKDVDQKVLKYQCPDNVHVPAIQYITVEVVPKNVTLAPRYEVNVSCSSEVNCTKNSDRPPTIVILN